MTPNEPNTIAFTIPIRVESKTNARGHWAKLHRQARAERDAAKFFVLANLQARPELRPKPPLFVMLTRVAPRPLDSDNLRGALKSVRDGIADAFGVDDSDRQGWWWDYAQVRGGRGEYAVEVSIQARGKNHDNSLASPATRG